MATKRFKDRPPIHTTYLVRNRSSRYGVVPKGIAVHTTESANVPGLTDLRGVRTWFDNPQSQASSWIGVDGEGHSELWVRAADKAWTMGDYDINAATLNIEFVGRASQHDWPTVQLKSGAKWAAWACLRFAIPAQRGDITLLGGEPRVNPRGILRHKDLTDVGVGTHTDPGWSGETMEQFIGYVRYYVQHGWELGITV